MHWFDHFLTKLSKYLWIKTGDRHYHFVEPWVIDRPFCRMETLYRNHFVETGVGSLQNWAPQPPPGNGKEDSFIEFSVVKTMPFATHFPGNGQHTTSKNGTGGWFMIVLPTF